MRAGPICSCCRSRRRQGPTQVVSLRRLKFGGEGFRAGGAAGQLNPCNPQLWAGCQRAARCRPRRARKRWRLPAQWAPGCTHLNRAPSCCKCRALCCPPQSACSSTSPGQHEQEGRARCSSRAQPACGAASTVAAAAQAWRWRKQLPCTAGTPAPTAAPPCPPKLSGLPTLSAPGCPLGTAASFLPG